jgi:hypothetical protein
MVILGGNSSRSSGGNSGGGGSSGGGSSSSSSSKSIQYSRETSKLVVMVKIQIQMRSELVSVVIQSLMVVVAELN